MDSKNTHALTALAIAMLLSFNTGAQLQTGDSLRPRMPLPWPEVPLNQWRFDDPAWLTNARTQPLLMNGPSFVASWSGYALRMAGTGPSLLALPEMSADAKTNLPANGPATLRFWFAPDWASQSAGGGGPGEEVRLLETGAWSSENAATRCALIVEADGGALRLDLAGSLGAQTIARSSIQWQAGVWHQVAVVSSSAGTFLYVDGQSVASGTGLALLPIGSTGWANGFCVGSDVAGGRLAQGSFDELMTFARVLAPGELALDYQRNAGRAALGPIIPGMAMESSAPDLTDTNGGPSTLTSNKAMLAEFYGCALWLHIARSTNGSSNVLVTLHNTVGGGTYKLWTKQQLVATQSWTLETNLTGISGQNFTTNLVPMNGRSNLIFFATTGGFFTNKSFAGLQYTNSGIATPDSMGAVGRNHFLEVLNANSTNTAVAVFDKCSGELVQRVKNHDFFAVQYCGTNYPTGFTVDSRVLYDHFSNRWIATTLDLGSENVILAVSKDSNPLDLTNNWDKYLLPFARAGLGTDFPTLGLDAKGIYLSTSTRVKASGGYGGNLMLILNKAKLYQQVVVSNFLDISTNDLPAHVIQPAINFDSVPRGGWAWFVSKRDRDTGGTHQGGAVSYRRLSWSETNGVWTTNWAETNWTAVSNSPIYRDYFDLDDGDVDAPQAPDENGITHGINLHHTGSRLMMAVIRDGALWACQQVGLSETNGTYNGNETGTNVNRSGIQWLKLSTDTNGSFLSMTNGRIYDPTNANPRYYYFPSLMVNAAGDVAFGFSGAKSNEYVSAFYTWRAADGTQPSHPVLMHAGSGAFVSGQFGDYSATSLDPIDGISFWTVQGYSNDPDGPIPWGTWISQIFPTSPPP